MDLLINVFLNCLDIVMFYHLYFGVVGEKPKYNYKALFTGLIWGTLHGISYLFIDISYYKFLLYISIFLYIWNLCRKKIHDVFIIFMLEYLLLFIIQLLILTTIQPIKIDNDSSAILGQILAVVLILLICRLPIDKVYSLLQEDILMKFMFYIMAGIFFIIYHKNFVLTEILYNTPYILIIIWGLFCTLKSISYYTTKFPSIDHEIRNVLMGIYLSVNYNNDIEKIKKEVNSYIQELGLDLVNENIEAGMSQKDRILNFVRTKDFSKNIYINSVINYYEENSVVTLSSIITMLGILLDNAIDASPENEEIKLDLLCGEYNLVIEVTNKYIGKIDISKIFRKNYSTKSTKRGYGLSNLTKIVNNYGGTIEVLPSNGHICFKIIILN